MRMYCNFGRKIIPNFLIGKKKSKKFLLYRLLVEQLKDFFSKTGFILRPHRRTMKDRTAERLFFLKGKKIIL